MASYHFSVQIIARSDGRSSVGAAAYRAAEHLVCSRDGMEHDYTRKTGVLFKEIVLPEHAPERWLDRSTLWNEVEQTERSANAQLARETVFAVPHELTREQQIEFCREVVREVFVSQGMVADWALHDAGRDGHNIHCHVMCPLRSCDEDGFLAKAENVYTVRNADGEERKATGSEFKELKGLGFEKVYKYRLDKEYRELTPTEAEAWEGCKRVGKNAVQESRYLNDWNDSGNVERWRKQFADLQNAALARVGSTARVDHRSYERQGVERAATVHEGPAVQAMERKAAREAVREGRAPATVTDRRAENDEVRETNALIAMISATTERLREQAAARARSLRAGVGDLAWTIAREAEAWRERVTDAFARMSGGSRVAQVPTPERQREQKAVLAAQADRRREAYRRRLMDPRTRLKGYPQRLASADAHRDLTAREKSFLRPDQLASYERTREAELAEARLRAALARKPSSNGLSPAQAPQHVPTPTRTQDHGISL